MNVAELNARNDSFISMLLEVSGRARPSDLHSVRPEDAQALLAAYRSAHPEMQLGFEGDTLVYGAAATPVAASEAPVSAPQPFAAAPAARADEPPAVAPAPPVTPPAEPAAVAPPAEPAAAPPEAPAPETQMWDFTTPAPESVDPFAVAPSTEPAPAMPQAPDASSLEENLPSWVYQQDSAAHTDLTGFSAPPPASEFAPELSDFEELPDYVEYRPPLPPIPWSQWLLSALLPLLGFYWYFERRKDDPQAAKRLLVFTLAAALVLIVVLAAVVFVFGPTLVAAFSG